MAEYEYKCLSQEERDDMLTETLRSQERDLFAFTVNLDRYQAMVEKLPDGDHKAWLTSEIKVLESRVVEVSTAIAATIPQMRPDGGASLARVKQREADSLARR